MIKNKIIIIISGPTGVGKSDFAEKLARTLPIEIINADVGQFYKPLTIGTAKPDFTETRVPHHLFDILNTPINFSVSAFRDRVSSLLTEIWDRDHIPVLVGGSLFYLSSLFFPPRVGEIETVDTFKNVHTDALWHKLYAIDPERARAIEKNDRYRIIRALNIWLSTGCLPSYYAPHYDPLCPYLFYFLTRDTKLLNQRINSRVKKMIAKGWIAEVEQLISSDWIPFLKEKRLIGYNDIIQFLEKGNQEEYARLIEIVSRKTRRYAKRQKTFWRRLKLQLTNHIQRKQDSQSVVYTLDLNQNNESEYITKISTQLKERSSK